MTTEAVCVHHWRIEEPHGTALVTGTCGHCGESREYAAGDRGGDDFKTKFSLKKPKEVRGPGRRKWMTR